MSSSKRKLYHTHLKYLAHENLLSSDILSKIPKSTLARWMNENPNRYEAFDLNLRASADYETIHHFAQNNSVKRIYSAYVRISKFILAIVHRLPGFHQSLQEQCKQVVELVQRVREVIGLGVRENAPLLQYFCSDLPQLVGTITDPMF